MSWVIHIGAGKWQNRAILKSVDMGYKVLSVDGDDSAIGFAVSNMTLVVDIRDIEKTKSSVLKIIKNQGLQVVAVHCVANEAGQISASVIREELNLSGLKLEQARALTNKVCQRELFNSQYLLTPNWVEVISEHSISEIKTKIEKKIGEENIIVKPADSSGSRGITVLRGYDLEQLKAAVEFALKASVSNKAIVEQYINGKEYTIESITIDGVTHVLMVTKKHKVDGTDDTVARRLVSNNIGIKLIKNFEYAINSFCQSTSINDCIGHTEVIKDSEGRFWLVEMAGRGAGFGVFEKMLPVYSDYDVIEASLKIDLGMPVIVPAGISERFAGISFLVSKKGKLIKLELDKSKLDIKDKSVWFEKFCKEGDMLGEASTDGDRVGYVLAVADTLNELIQKLDETERCIDYEVN